MTSMIFRATSSPCSAIYVKNRNASEYHDEFPKAASAIEKKNYMDDYLDSVDSTEEEKKLVADVIEVYKRGGFEMRSWMSNKS